MSSREAGGGELHCLRGVGADARRCLHLPGHQEQAGGASSTVALVSRASKRSSGREMFQKRSARSVGVSADTALFSCRPSPQPWLRSLLTIAEPSSPSDDVTTAPRIEQVPPLQS
eukprot:764884-Hanusia_phi.AAC.7